MTFRISAYPGTCENLSLYAPQGCLGAYSNRTVHPSVLLYIRLFVQLYILLSLVSVCSRHVQTISPILFEVGIPDFDVWMHLRVAECLISFRSLRPKPLT